MTKEIICLGELLIDFICEDTGLDLKGGENFVKRAGGAPANVAATASRLGVKGSFAGCVGNDPFGDFLIESLNHHGVDTTMITKKGNTTMAFVSIMDDGERDFVFVRGADEQYEIKGFEERFSNCKILHLGSATALLGGNLKKAYEESLKLALDNDVFLSFDPNYRGDLWKGREGEFIELAKEYISQVHFVKLSQDELFMIYGENNLDKALDKMYKDYNSLSAITLGSKGTYLATPQKRMLVPSIKINPVDTTGAGDAFVGAFLSQLVEEENLKGITGNFEKLKEKAAKANKVAALVCTKLGAMTALDVISL
ncbi:carbohydrate kinase family protein [Anaerobranca gottschalkii]|uniref:Fructokinase n=1 Tax=Anaerobranca gottschalkii DSM 13577 TaxID=1120990 RepID=A0A1I0C7I4_9FIRM|nr:carbohydrate kinase [Anaerobranca gottschalkii]SET14900.1 fructokinase [Anaerobranca gottschalkii DSM 13577]